jgi:hypothetical protein
LANLLSGDVIRPPSRSECETPPFQLACTRTDSSMPYEPLGLQSGAGRWPELAVSRPAAFGRGNVEADVHLRWRFTEPTRLRSTQSGGAIPYRARRRCLHSITLSARAIIESGRLISKDCAVFILTASSKRLGRSIGKSPGLLPFKIFTT